MRRAGLDYHEYANVARHASWEAFIESCHPLRERMFAMTTHSSSPAHAIEFKAGDWLVFGSESKGLPPEVRAQFPNEQRLRLPMLASQRSLNLSNAVAVTVFEAWRQQGFAGAALAEPKTAL